MAIRTSRPPGGLRPSILAVAAAFVAACGPGPAPDAPDAGLPRADAGAREDVIVTPHVPEAPRRGPIALAFDVVDPDGDVSPAFELEWNDAGTWRTPTLTHAETSARSASYVWDSFADAPYDGPADFRFTARDPDGDVTLTFTLEVRNNPDADRLVVVAHKLRPIEGGGARDDGNELSVFAWDGLGPGTLGEPVRIPVGYGPERLRAAPHGRAVALVAERDGQVNVVSTPLNALVASVARSTSLILPHGHAADVRWSRDGRHLFVLGGTEAGSAPTLWRYTPLEDLTSFGAPEPVATLPGPPMAFDVDARGRFLVSCGSGGEGLGKLVLLGADGAELARVEEDFAPANALVFAPHGAFALMTADFFGDELRRFAVGDASLAQDGPTLTSMRTPYDVIFHPESTPESSLALVSNFDRNQVTPVLLTATSTTPRTPATGLPLAAEMDLIERGAQAGTVLVPFVSATSSTSGVKRVTLGANGSATSEGTAIELGEGTTAIPNGIAIQR